MSRTLNDLIAAAVTGGEEVESSSALNIEVQHEAPALQEQHDIGDVEKIAGALEFLARRGLANVLGHEKVAMAHCPGCGAKCKTCSGKSCNCCKCGKTKKAAHNVPDSGTNMSQSHAPHVQSQVKHNSQSSPMKVPGFGLMPNNAGAKPGGGGSVDTTGKEGGTHHSALASNEAAINYDKREKAKKVAPALSAVLDNKPYADGKLKENLSGAAGKGDKNINKTAHDADAIRAELERRRTA